MPQEQRSPPWVNLGKTGGSLGRPARSLPGHARPISPRGGGSLSREGERGTAGNRTKRPYRTVESVEPMSGRRAKLFATRDTRMARQEGIGGSSFQLSPMREMIQLTFKLERRSVFSSAYVSVPPLAGRPGGLASDMIQRFLSYYVELLSRQRVGGERFGDRVASRGWKAFASAGTYSP